MRIWKVWLFVPFLYFGFVHKWLFDPLVDQPLTLRSAALVQQTGQWMSSSGVVGRTLEGKASKCKIWFTQSDIIKTQLYPSSYIFLLIYVYPQYCKKKKSLDSFLILPSQTPRSQRFSNHTCLALASLILKSFGTIIKAEIMRATQSISFSLLTEQQQHPATSGFGLLEGCKNL